MASSTGPSLPAKNKDAEDAPRLPLTRVISTLALGLAGGFCFAFAGVPLAWLLGALATTVVGVFLGLPLGVPEALRTTMAAVLGVMIGATFTPDVITAAVQWWPTILLLFTVMAVMSFAGTAYFRLVGGFDKTTSYFASAPGGLSEMAILGESFGGDLRIITLVHATRVAIVVTVVPLFYRFFFGLEATALSNDESNLFLIPIGEAGILLSCAVLGVLSAKRLGLPAPAFVGPLILSVFAHLGGLSYETPPPALIALAQVVLGISVGCRFSGLEFRQVRNTLFLAVGAAFLFLVIAIAGASIAGPFLGRDVKSLMLALAPGGVVEMGLVALALGVSTAYVSTMHIFRIIILVTVMPFAYRLVDNPKR